MAWWRFEETTGTVAHDELGGHDGTYVGDVVLGAPGIPVGRGVDLHGTSRPHIITSSADSRFVGRAPYTVEVWVLARSLNDYGRLASNEDPTTSRSYGWYLGADADGSKVWHEFATATDTVRSIVWPGTLSPQRFQHVVARYDGTTMSLWIDAVRVVEGTATANGPDVGSLTLGMSPGERTGQLHRRCPRRGRGVLTRARRRAHHRPSRRRGTVAVGCVHGASPACRRRGLLEENGSPLQTTISREAAECATGAGGAESVKALRGRYCPASLHAGRASTLTSVALLKIS
jgi:hypothetical protein